MYRRAPPPARILDWGFRIAFRKGKGRTIDKLMSLRMGEL